MIKVTMPQISIKKIEKQLKEKYKDKALEVGFFETAKYGNGQYVAQVAVWNEYGTHNIPPRPFFRSAINENSKEWLKTFKWLVADKGTDIALEMTGVEMKNDISKSITNFSSPANSPITINGGWMTTLTGKPFFVKGKGSSNPLVDTGFMRNSVAYRITK